MSIQGEVEKKYDPFDTTLTFVNRMDDLDPLCKINFLSHWAWQKSVTNKDSPLKCHHQQCFIFFELLNFIVIPRFLTNLFLVITTSTYLLLCTSVSDDDCNSLRAEMSCGHAVTPGSLTEWCRSQLKEVSDVLKMSRVLASARCVTLKLNGSRWWKPDTVVENHRWGSCNLW